MTLKEWHNERRNAPRTLDPQKIGSKAITIVTYIYGAEDYVAANFYQIANAIRETWFHFGFLKTVIVTNVNTPAANSFHDEFRDWVRIDYCDKLRANDLYEYSRDCIANLYTRFDTPYMLFIHPDGFPLRPGIEEFLGKYDYVGAPWTRKDDFWGKLLLSRSHLVGNGGFSLRSHAICEAASRAYKRFWRILPNCFLLYEDYFFCRFLTRFSPGYARKFNFAPLDSAKKFALEHFDEAPTETPLGFHSAAGFERLSKES